MLVDKDRKPNWKPNNIQDVDETQVNLFFEDLGRFRFNFNKLEQEVFSGGKTKMNNVYIMSANRSAIGGFGGTLKNHCPVDLGTFIGKEKHYEDLDMRLMKLSMLFLVMLYTTEQRYVCEVELLHYRLEWTKHLLR